MNFLNQAINFLRESKNELSKVVWPSKKEVFRYTTIIIITIIIATVLVGIFDILLIKIVQLFVLR